MVELGRLIVDSAALLPRQLVLEKQVFSALSLQADYLLVMTLPGDYQPGEGQYAMVQHLLNQGVDLNSQLETAELDLRPIVPCWITAPLPERYAFRRIVVFECEPAELTGRDIWMAYDAVRLFHGQSTVFKLANTVLAGIDATTAMFRNLFRMSFFASVSCAARAPLHDASILVDDAHTSEQSTVEYFMQLAAAYQNPPNYPPQVQVILDGFPFEPLVEHKFPKQVSVTDRQMQAIFAYTASTYYWINNALRYNDVTHPDYEFWQPTIEAISSGLSGLNSFLTTGANRVYRGMKWFEGFEAVYALHEVSTEFAFTSTSKNRAFPYPYKFSMGSLNGKDVSEFSAHPDEGEVLFDLDLRHLLYKWEASATDHLITSDQVLPEYAIEKYFRL